MNGIDIKVERTRLGVRQYRLAAALDVPQATLCAIENGRRPIDHSRAVEIAKILRNLATQEDRTGRSSK